MRVPGEPPQGRTSPTVPPSTCSSPPAGVVGASRLQRHLRDAADGGEGLAAEAFRGDAEEVVGGAELAGGVGGEGEAEVVGVDAASVVDDADEVESAVFEVDIDAGGAGVDTVFEEFLDGAGGPFDHLPGGDLRDDLGGQQLDARHGVGVWIGPSTGRCQRSDEGGCKFCLMTW